MISRATPDKSGILRRTLGGLVVALAVAVMAAWLARAEILSAAAPDFGTMVFTTAACLALLGSSVLLLSESGSVRHRRTITGLGIVVVTLAGLTLAEHITQFNLGVDLPELHRWLQTRAPAPGRMAIGTSFALLLLGTALCLWPLAAHRYLGPAIQILTLCAIVIALFGIIIRTMRLEYLYTSHVFSSMALHTSLGIMTIGIALWLGWHKMPWNRFMTVDTDEQRIKTSGTAILLIVAISAGCFGFYASQDVMDKTLTDSHMRALRSRVQQVETVLEHRLMQAGTISTRLDLRERLHRFKDNADDPGLVAQMATIAEGWLPLGFSGILFQDMTGRVVRCLTCATGSFSCVSKTA